MDHYKIRIYKKAQSDLKEIVAYLNQFYSEATITNYDLIISDITKRLNNPKRCAFVRNEVLRRKGYRYYMVAHYVVFFVVKDVYLRKEQ